MRESINKRHDLVPIESDLSRSAERTSFGRMRRCYKDRKGHTWSWRIFDDFDHNFAEFRSLQAVDGQR
jgi:hypothetical protein